MSRAPQMTAESSLSHGDTEVTTEPRARKALSIGESFAIPKEPKKPRTITTTKAKRDKDARECKERREQGDWAGARPGHFVALYGACHEKIYGFIPSELESGKEYALAILAASRMLRSEFEGKSEIMVEFMRWAWKREEGREKWRRDNGKSGQRLGWRLQFNGSLLSDYRVDLARRKGNAER